MVTTVGPAKVCFVTYYQPSEPNRSKHQRGKIREGVRRRIPVLKQHACFHTKNDVRTDPRALAGKCLLTKLKEWRADGKEILLMGDFNPDSYASPLARHLSIADTDREEQFQKLHGSIAPFSPMLDKKAILAVYATSLVTVRSYFISKHHAM